MSGGGLGEHGYRVVPDVLDPDEVAEARRALDDVFTAEADIAEERGWLTDAHRVAYALPAKHPTFLRLVTHPGLVALAGAALDSRPVIASFNGMTTVPGGTGQDLHRDHPEPTPPHVLFAHLVVALDPFTRENGATRIVPGSNRLPVEPTDLDELEMAATTVEVPAGGVVAYDGTVWHAASANATREPRRALHVFFARSWVKPHWDFAATFGAKEASQLSAEQRRLLGFADLVPHFDVEARTVEGW